MKFSKIWLGKLWLIGWLSCSSSVDDHCGVYIRVFFQRNAGLFGGFQPEKTAPMGDSLPINLGWETIFFCASQVMENVKMLDMSSIHTFPKWYIMYHHVSSFYKDSRDQKIQIFQIFPWPNLLQKKSPSGSSALTPALDSPRPPGRDRGRDRMSSSRRGYLHPLFT